MSERKNPSPAADLPLPPLTTTVHPDAFQPGSSRRSAREN
jgi:hypothetical protein